MTTFPATGKLVESLSTRMSELLEDCTSGRDVVPGDFHGHSLASYDKLQHFDEIGT